MKHLQRLLLLCGLALTVPAWGATATGTLAVTGTVVASCTIAGTPMSFGTTIAAPILANIDVTGTVTATCTNGTPYTIAASAGTGAGATVATRRMTSGANTMNYSLFRDAARSQVWGVTTGTNTIAGTGNGAPQPISIFGRIFAGQATVRTGAYADTVTLTVTF